MGWRALAGQAVDAALMAVPMRAWEAVAPGGLALCYHSVSAEPLPHVRPLFAYKTPAEFTEDLDYLRSRYDLVTVAELEERLGGADGRGRPALAITFDDGLRECHSVVLPILRRAGIRATFFLVTACLDNRAIIYRHQTALCLHRLGTAEARERGALVDAVERELRLGLGTAQDLVRLLGGLRADRTGLLDRISQALGLDVPRYLQEHAPYLTRAQALELAGEGHLLGAHGVTHRDLQCLGEAEIEEEIVRSCEVIGAITAQARVSFAAPFSLERLDRSLLQRIRRSHRGVGWIYGTSGFLKEPDGLLNRVVADSPRRSRSGRSNLPFLLRSAHAARARLALKRLGGSDRV
jgi:peptidoglycan/xylan/chitin deacetylase (PgdA/CDA1 family)